MLVLASRGRHLRDEVQEVHQTCPVVPQVEAHGDGRADIDADHMPASMLWLLRVRDVVSGRVALDSFLVLAAGAGRGSD